MSKRGQEGSMTSSRQYSPAGEDWRTKLLNLFQQAVLEQV